MQDPFLMEAEELIKERQYLEVMCRKYILVYYVNLQQDRAKVLKLDEHSNVWKMPEMRPGVWFPYREHIEGFADQFILNGKEEFCQKLQKEYIEKEMQKVTRFMFCFDGVPNQTGNHNYQVHVLRVNPDTFDGRVMVVSEEMDAKLLVEQQRQEELDNERKYLDVLTHDFAAVYHVDLAENQSRLIKVDSLIARQNAYKISLRQTNNYQDRVELYCKRFVIPPLQKEFMQIMSRENIMKKLQNNFRYIYRYRTIQENAGQQYYEVSAMRMKDISDNRNILIAFRHIDDVVTQEQQRQMELEERLERERSQNEVLSALGKSYDAIFLINIQSDSYTKISCQEKIRHYYDEEETSAERVLEGLCRKIIAPKHSERMQQFFRLKTLARRLKNREFVEIECMTREDNWYRTRFIVKRRDEAGEVTDVLYVLQLIDDEKQHEENLIARAEYADYANRAKTDFISQVAHDIRTPMNSIFGFLEIAEANMGNWDKVRYSLKKIRAAGEFLKDLVNDVLDISRMEKGAMKLCPEEFDFTDTIRELAVSMQVSGENKEQDFQFEIQNVLQDRVITDSLRLKQIFANVLSNAMKYTPKGGSIRFLVHQEALPQNDRVRIVAVIEDTGIGMSEEFMKKMFNKFERATDTRVNAVSGYGLGLSIVRQLIDILGGTLDVQSQLGIGTTVRIELDVDYADAVPKKLQNKIKPAADICSGMHLLVAEDNELNREVITELLSLHGITCDCAEDGKICLERFAQAKRGEYDAVLMDMQMPNMNGVDAAKQIRRLPQGEKIPIVAMTANALQTDIQKCLDAGMNRHLSKPVDIGLLLRTLAEIKEEAEEYAGNLRRDSEGREMRENEL